MHAHGGAAGERLQLHAQVGLVRARLRVRVWVGARVRVSARVSSVRVRFSSVVVRVSSVRVSAGWPRRSRPRGR